MDHTNTTLKPRYHSLQTQPTIRHKTYTKIKHKTSKNNLLNNLKPKQSCNKWNVRPRHNIPHLTFIIKNVTQTKTPLPHYTQYKYLPPPAHIHNIGSYQIAIPLERLTWLWGSNSLYTPIENYTLSPPIQDFAIEILLLINQYIKLLSRREPPTNPLHS